uniref:Uncharacterized protein n=1 Tax=Arundo donax TaxID=35708 RepID=A0A0A9CGP4_ARUDO
MTGFGVSWVRRIDRLTASWRATGRWMRLR